MLSVDNFYVIAVISNPVRYRSRYELYRKFEAEMKISGANLFTVECAFGDRPFEVTDSHNPMNLQIRTWDELWHKENMINLGIRRLPPNWTAVGWLDADISFIRPDWITETVHQLQHYQVVQMFQNAIDLGPRGEALDTHNSFGWCWLNGKALQVNWKPYMIYPHTGFAWAARREAIDHLGGLIDTAILGAADHHMAWSLIGKGAQTFPPNIHTNYTSDVLNWEARALKFIQKDIGFVPGTITHHWHGKKKDRKYVDRWQILTKNHYDPRLDLKLDWQGLYQLTDRNPQLRDDIRAYFRSRLEDSTDLE